MFETLVGLDLAQRNMKAQFEMDRPVATSAPRASREHRPRLRVVSVLAMRVFARTKEQGARGPATDVPPEQRALSPASGRPLASRALAAVSYRSDTGRPYQLIPGVRLFTDADSP